MKLGNQNRELFMADILISKSKILKIYRFGLYKNKFKNAEFVIIL